MTPARSAPGMSSAHAARCNCDCARAMAGACRTRARAGPGAAGGAPRLPPRPAQPAPLEASGLGAGPRRSALLRPRLRPRRWGRDQSGHACRGLQLRRGRRVPRAPLRAAGGRSGRSAGHAARGRPAAAAAPRALLAGGARVPACRARLGPQPARALPPRRPALRRCPAQRRLRLPRPRRPDPGGRTFKGLAPGSRKARGGFWLPPPRAAPTAVLLVESALDAPSVHQCPPPGLPAATLIASTAGLTATWPPWLDPWSALPPLCGYDADPAGDRADTALQRQCPAVRLHRPRAAKDWNELLQRSRTP